MSESDCTTLTRVCTKCGREYPATLEYFYALKSGKDGLHSQCKGCRGEYGRSLRAADLEKSAAQQKAWRDAHPGYGQAWWATHTLDRTEYHRAYAAAHREERAARQAVYYASHHEERAAYRAEHREDAATASRNYDARKLGNGGTHTTEDILTQYDRQNGRCLYCHEKVGDTYHVDHVMPVILGGYNGPENLVISCPKCNLSKGGKHPMDFCGRLL